MARRAPGVGRDFAPGRTVGRSVHARAGDLRPSHRLRRRHAPGGGIADDQRGADRFGRARRPQRGNAADLRSDPQPEDERHDDSSHGRARDRQGAARARDPSELSRSQRGVRRGELRRAAGRSPRERAVRPRAGNSPRADRRGGAGESRHALSRRDRRSPRGGPAQAAPAPSGADVRDARATSARESRRRGSSPRRRSTSGAS